MGEQKDSFLTPTTLKNHSKREGGQRGIEDTSLEKQCRLLLGRVAEKRAVLVGKWDQKFPYKVARISLTDPWKIVPCVGMEQCLQRSEGKMPFNLELGNQIN